MKPIAIDADLSMRFKLMALLCSFLVVIIHCVAWFNVESKWAWFALRDGICRIAVPYFFFASGFFLVGNSDRRGWWFESVKKRLHTLLLPYFLFLILFLVARSFVYGQDFSVDVLFEAFGFDPFHHPVLLPFWYIRSLFILIVLSPIILVLLQFVDRCCRFGGAFCIVAFALYGLLGPYEGMHGEIHYFFRKFLALQGLFYMSCGMAFRLGELDFRLKYRTSICLLGMGLSLMGVKVYCQSIDAACYIYFGWAAVPLITVSVFNLIPLIKMPSQVLSCAFPIYVMHMFVLQTICYVALKFNMAIGDGWVLWPVGTVLVFGMTLLLCFIQRRMLPQVNGVIWGGR